MSNGAATILGIAIIIATVLHGLLGMYQITATETDAGAVAFCRIRCASCRALSRACFDQRRSIL